MVTLWKTFNPISTGNKPSTPAGSGCYRWRWRRATTGASGRGCPGIREAAFPETWWRRRRRRIRRWCTSRWSWAAWCGRCRLTSRRWSGPSESWERPENEKYFNFKEGGSWQASSARCCWLRRTTVQTTGLNDAAWLRTRRSTWAVVKCGYMGKKEGKTQRSGLIPYSPW